MVAIKEPATTSGRSATELSDGSDDKAPIPTALSVDDSDSNTEEALRRQALSALTPAEEKKLLRRIDWHLMPLCSLIFMFKNLDVDNVRTI